MAKSPFATVDEYIASHDEAVADKLRRIRLLIRETAPDAEEKLSWGAPTYYYHGYLLQFAAGKNHIGFYTSPETLEHFRDALTGFKTNAKNTLQIPLTAPMPEELLKQMIRFRLAEKA